eukprot:TRINITY_DN511_c0_g1_i5.p1 TRINITY_DN511_c0_g1~~TRINITY_DN511_c0_g1_i5.p1  ORF type:complete len:218 (+),score=56.06 TRINITY_DN511_c0_g1_i5:246-899(+)
MGFYIGITGWVCDSRRGKELRSIVSRIPKDKIMIETDGPFLTPHIGMPEGCKVRRNEPCLLPVILTELAKCMDLTATELAESSTKNAISFFGISDEKLGPRPEGASLDSVKIRREPSEGNQGVGRGGQGRGGQSSRGQGRGGAGAVNVQEGGQGRGGQSSRGQGRGGAGAVNVQEGGQGRGGQSSRGQGSRGAPEGSRGRGGSQSRGGRVQRGRGGF